MTAEFENSGPFDVSPGDAPDDLAASQPRVNFLTMVCYQITIRTGWIFKTESIIMPAVMDAMGGAGWLRACLPMLNRFGQSIPPLMASSMVARRPLKKWILVTCTSIMGLVFVLLGLFWRLTGGQGSWYLPFVFLTLYAVFFSAVGVNQLSLATTIGKLIPTRRRGLLMLCATTIGAVSAVSAAWFLLRIWLQMEVANFTAIFLFAGISFFVAALIAANLREARDSSDANRISLGEIFKSVYSTLRDNREFRQLSMVAALFGMSMTLFPHYQALGRERLGLQTQSLLTFVIAQNIGMALFSIPAGRLADQFGNRLVLRIVMLMICVGPILAIVLSQLPEVGPAWFFCVFVIIGLTPVTMRVFSNFALELTTREQQPKFLGVLSLCMAGPAIFTSTLLGLLLDFAGFETVFLLVTSFLFIGWLMTFRLIEPRDSD